MCLKVPPLQAGHVVCMGSGGQAVYTGSQMASVGELCRSQVLYRALRWSL